MNKEAGTHDDQPSLQAFVDGWDEDQAVPMPKGSASAAAASRLSFGGGSELKYKTGRG